MNDEISKKNNNRGENSNEHQQFEKGDGEPDSGLINFEELAARASSPGDKPIERSSIVPRGGIRKRGRDRTPLEIAVSDAPLPVYSKQKNTALYVVFSLFIVAIAGAVAVFLVHQRAASDSKMEEAKLIAEIKAKLEKSKAPEEAVAQTAAPGQSALATPASVELESAPAPAPEARGEVNEQGAGEENTDGEPAVKPAAPRSWKGPATSRSLESGKGDAPKVEEKLDESLFLDAKKVDAEKTEAKDEPTAPSGAKAGPKAGDDGLDDLLGLSGSKPADEKPAKAKTAPDENAQKTQSKPVENQEPAAKETKQSLSREDVVAGMKLVVAKAGSCSQYASGTVKVKITVNGSGRVQQAQSQGEHANTKVGQCVEIITKVAKFPEFQGPPVVINYPVTIP